MPQHNKARFRSIQFLSANPNGLQYNRIEKRLVWNFCIVVREMTDESSSIQLIVHSHDYLSSCLEQVYKIRSPAPLFLHSIKPNSLIINKQSLSSYRYKPQIQKIMQPIIVIAGAVEDKNSPVEQSADPSCEDTLSIGD